MRINLILTVVLVFTLSACAGGPSEDQQATLLAVAVQAALTENAPEATPTEGEEDPAPAATEEPTSAAPTEAPTEAPSDTPTDEPTLAPVSTPVVVFKAAGSFSNAEKNQLRERVIQPFVQYYAEMAEHPALVSLSLEKMDIAGYPYGADAIFEGGVASGFLISNNSAPVDWWYPDCMGPCPFSDAFRTAYPEIVAIVEP